MKKLSVSQVDRFYAITGASIIGLGGLAYTAYHVSSLTQVVMVAGTVAPDGAIESTQAAFDGVPYVLSIVPASLGMKVFVAGILVTFVVIACYYTYKYIQAYRINRHSLKTATA
jgi:hypothetical protein